MNSKIMCPYNSKHKVEPRNLATHLEKCRKTLPVGLLSKFGTCRYNSLHIFPVFDLGAHEQNCPSKAQMIFLEKALKDESSIRVLAEESSRATNSVFHTINSISMADTVVKDKDIPHNVGQINKYEHIDLEQEKSWNELQNSNHISTRGNGKMAASVSQQNSNVEKKDMEVVHENKADIIKRDGDIQLKKEIRVKEQKQTAICQKKLKSVRQLVPPISPKVQQKEEVSSERVELHECLQCNRILCDSGARLWRDKKVIKYLKAYQKLEQQHKQILSYISSITSILQKRPRKHQPEYSQIWKIDQTKPKQHSTQKKLNTKSSCMKNQANPINIHD